jgi:two-component system, NtrC family, response regulator HydG
MSDERARVLVVDDKPEMAETVADGLRDSGYQVITAHAGREALRLLESERPEALVTDLRLPGIDGLALLAASRKLEPLRPVIVMTAFGAIDSAIESIRQGANHYLTKPFKAEELLIFLGRALEEVRLRREAASLKTTLKATWSPPEFVGRSGAIREVLDIVQRLAPTDAPVLLTGETGTGKSQIAKLLHGQSGRAGGPFVSINCAALPEALLESELFGHTKGAFTGAAQERAGLFAEADRGTLLLDEIGEMPASLQAKLLHVLETRTVRPVGASRERPIDVRIVSATHRDLRERVRAGSFREDLLYRLDVVPVHLPALRKRREDVALLAQHFLERAKERYPASPVQRLSREAMARLYDYRWPGNVRELAHALERLVLLGRSAEIGFDELPQSIREAEAPKGMSFGQGVLPMRELQRRYCAWALQQSGGHRGRTAEVLGIDPKTLAKYLLDETQEASR